MTEKTYKCEQLNMPDTIMHKVWAISMRHSSYMSGFYIMASTPVQADAELICLALNEWNDQNGQSQLN